MRSYFWPFTEVQNGNQREVMRKLRQQPRIKLQYVFSTTRTDDTPVLLIIWRSVILDGCRGIELEPGDIARALDRYETCWRDSSNGQRSVAGVA